MDNPVMAIDPNTMPPRDAYRLLISVVVPRPIAWVSTLGADGSRNLAPFSFFNAVASPLTIMVSIAKRQGAAKDTLRNVQETGEFVVNVADESLIDAVNQSSGDYEYGVDEFERVGVTPATTIVVRPPRVAEAAVSMEAVLSQIVPVEGTSYTMVLGRVVYFHVRQGLLRPNGLVEASLLRAVARLGGDEYTTMGRILELKRPAATSADFTRGSL